MKKTSILIIVWIVASTSLQISCAQTSPCPANHEKAEKYLKEYLSNEENIENLQRDELNLDESSFKKVHAIQMEENKLVCSNLSMNAPWLDNIEDYAFYKTDNYYFIVKYSISGGNFNRKGIDIFNKEFERLISVIEF